MKEYQLPCKKKKMDDDDAKRHITFVFYQYVRVCLFLKDSQPNPERPDRYLTGAEVPLSPAQECPPLRLKKM